MVDRTSMSPCGINCSECAIFLAARDPAVAEQLARGWRANGFPDASADWFRCVGCAGDRSKCWSEDCAIRACCVDERGFTSCADCPDFPCTQLREWAQRGKHHADALQRLEALHESRSL